MARATLSYGSSTHSGSSSLKSFIKDVRNAKTLADERAIINKQAAKIRTKLRDDHLSSEKKRNNIIKLLYLYILGERTHFGQVECINLIASDRYIDKRLGYLSTTLLLDESQDLLTLLTNLINNDLKHPNKYVISLALTALGFLSSPELARDLYPDVEGLLNRFSNDPFILKKALQCCAKLISKDSQLLEIIPIDLFLKLLGEYRSNLTSLSSAHGVLLGISRLFQAIAMSAVDTVRNISTVNLDTTVTEGDDVEDALYKKTLATELFKNLGQSDFLKDFYQVLTSLSARNLDPQFDVQGVSDPFLQCEIITTLRLYFKACSDLEIEVNQDLMDDFNDLLTNLATNTDATKSSGQSILYEITRTIFELNLSKPLQVLGINILANFLSPHIPGGKKASTAAVTAHNNIKYVALNTLLKVAPMEPEAVKRHKKFISRCLNDQDISIRMRALELTFSIMDSSNLVELVNELLNFLAKSVMNNENSRAAHSSYKTNTFGEDIDDSKDLIKYTVNHIIEKFDLISQEGGDKIDENWRLSVFVKILKLVGSYIPIERISDILIAINNTLEIQYKTDVITRMLDISLREVLTATQKEEQKISEVDQIEEDNFGWQLVSIWCIGEYADIVLQDLGTNNKSNENYTKTLNEASLVKYLQLKNKQYLRTHSKIVHYVLTAALKLSVRIQDYSLTEDLRQIIIDHTKSTDLLLQSKSSQYEIIFSQPMDIKKQILDAMPKFDRASRIEREGVSTVIRTSSATSKPITNDTKKDLLLDLLGEDDISKSTPTTDNKNLLAELLAGNKTSAKDESTDADGKAVENAIELPSGAELMQNFESFEIYSGPVKQDENAIHLELFYKNTGDTAMTDLQTMCAVTKTLKVILGQLHPSNSVQPGAIIKQSLKISGTGKLKMRVKLSYNIGGNALTQQFDHKFADISL
ncbi:AP-1 complex subunit gamma-1 [Nakaseomyces bracarensis]|uniref:AP-1 complex subunit gamma n=1 Tax=Nakaseomyces bracarensis TaxID=273131 RepID=A0ABR4P0H2_9SACH